MTDDKAAKRQLTTDIRPFRADVPEAELSELRRRIEATRWPERAYPKLVRYNRLDRGGHFAAWEQPELFSEEVRAGFRPMRSPGRTVKAPPSASEAE